MKDQFKYVVLSRPLTRQQREVLNCGCTPCAEQLTSGCSSTSACGQEDLQQLDRMYGICCGYLSEAHRLHAVALESRLDLLDRVLKETEAISESEEEKYLQAIKKADQDLQEILEKQANLPLDTKSETEKE